MAGCGVIAFCDASGAHAAIGKCGKDTAVVIYCNVIEVQQIACPGRARGSLGADHTELHGVRGSSIHRKPGFASIVGGGHVAMPHSVEWSAGIGSSTIPGRGRSQEKEGRAIIVTGNNFGKSSILEL